MQIGGNMDFRWVVPPEVDHRRRSLWMAVAWSLPRFSRLIIAGCPLDDPRYHVQRKYFRHSRELLAGKLFSLSGWTREFCEQQLGNRLEAL